MSQSVTRSFSSSSERCLAKNRALKREPPLMIMMRYVQKVRVLAHCMDNGVGGSSEVLHRRKQFGGEQLGGFSAGLRVMLLRNLRNGSAYGSQHAKQFCQLRRLHRRTAYGAR